MDELASFLTPSARLDVKLLALQQVLGLSASAEGAAALSCPAVLAALASLLKDPVEPVSSEACLVLVNLSSSSTTCSTILNLQPPIVPILIQLMQDKRGSKAKLAEKASMLISNLSREQGAAREVNKQMVSAGLKIGQIVSLLYKEGEEPLPYLGPTLSNLSQLGEVRTQLLSEDQDLLQKLLPFTEYTKSHVARGGVVGCLRNLSFSPASHPWLMGPKVDLVPRLVLPLAGPTPENLTDEEIEALPLDLQYLDDDKKIEEDLDIRTMLLETLNQLCATRQGRELMREKNIYVILRQFHNQEQDDTVRLAAENLVDILIKSEDEIKIDNYKDVEVPKDMVPELEKMDEPYLKT